MINILAVSFHYDEKSTGGAAKSFLNIIEGLNRDRNFHVERLSIKSIKKLFDPFNLTLFLNIPRIIRAINRVKPLIILTQTSPAFAAIIAANIKKIRVINIIRDTHLICPKYVDIIAYGEACKGLKSRRACFDCIDYWRTLRVIIGNRPKGWQYGFKAKISNLGYKIRYLTCKINIYLFNRATVNLVATELMKSFLSTQINSDKLKIVNITPIKERKFKDNIIKKKKQLLFIVPRYEASHKGLDFILRLSNNLPEGYTIVVVGSLLGKGKIKEAESKIINIGPVSGNKLNELYQNSEITLVPSFFNEAFGRVIIESISNGTPVISSPNCGANAYFKNKSFLKIIQINMQLWINAIEKMSNEPYQITKNEISSIRKQFSIEKSVSDFKILIQSLLNS